MSARIGVISDTHGRLDDVVLQKLQGCTHIIHAGDIVKLNILEQLSRVGNIYAVKGNCDAYLDCPLGKTLSFTIEGKRFFLVHDLYTGGPEMLKADIVIHGHLHRYGEVYKGARLILNPGSVSQPRGGEPASMAIITIENGIVKVQKITL